MEIRNRIKKLEERLSNETGEDKTNTYKDLQIERCKLNKVLENKLEIIKEAIKEYKVKELKAIKANIKREYKLNGKELKKLNKQYGKVAYSEEVTIPQIRLQEIDDLDTKQLQRLRRDLINTIYNLELRGNEPNIEKQLSSKLKEYDYINSRINFLT